MTAIPLQIDGGTRVRNDIFWGEISPCEHLVQIYEDGGVFLDALEGFVAGGLRVGDGVITIATSERLMALGVDLDAARARDQYISVDAEETLVKFMVNGWPDEVLFTRTVNELLARARSGGRRVRAFGEMVALMWRADRMEPRSNWSTCGIRSVDRRRSPCFAPIPGAVSRRMHRIQ